MIEVMLALITLALAGGAIARSVVSAATGYDQADDLAMAAEGARGMADRVEHTPIHELSLRFGAGGTQGPTFDVPGLPGVEQGTITLITNETSTDATLGMALGMPRDLDGDGKATSTDVSLTARVIPALVEVRWTRPGQGERSFQLPVVVTR